MGEDLPEIHLTVALTWECPACRARNFHLGEVCTDEEIEQARVELEEDQMGTIMREPSVVICAQCERAYPVAHPEAPPDW